MKIFSVIFLVVIGLFVFPDSTEYIQLPIIEEKAESKIILYFTGDIMLDRGVDFYIQKNEDWHWPFLQISDFLNEADLVSGNLESMISDKGVNVGSIYSFQANPNSIDSLRYAGFDILSIANNHSFDYTRVALEDTMSRLKDADIDYIGGGFSENEAYTPVIK
ncbi:MAG: CapA family protein, partial [Candidatus Marinimicrobia bacterium]|nr:CapA family protein [Candidatus Neomarinimicrobiota bacterium]